jgi:sugar/nucleoside kinase (ribokinase family)
MRVAVLGPICKDVVKIGQNSYEQPGGVTYYTGQALANLGIDTVVFGSLGQEDHDSLLSTFKPNVIPLEAQGTIHFENEYPDEQDLDNRIQRADIYNNNISPGSIKAHDMSAFDYIILGPLFNDNITKPLIEYLSQVTDASLVISPQGMIRYLHGHDIVWKNPDNVLNILKKIDYVFLDIDELKFISQYNNIDNGAKVLQACGAQNVAVTHGMHGSWLFFGEKRYDIQSFQPMPAEDPTGAGDSYMAGFIAAQDQPELDNDPLKHGAFAAMTATMSIENKGTFSGTRKEVLKRLGWE